MTKHDRHVVDWWWSTLTPFEKAIVREAPAFCGKVFNEFGPFEISDITYIGVEALKPTPWRQDDEITR